MKKRLVGSIVIIPMDDGEFCYARILENLDYAFYDYKTFYEETDLAVIIKNDILFTALVKFAALKESNWKIIGKIDLDERHKITPIYFHPDLTNISIYDYTVSKIKETLKYKTFEKGGIQDGGIYSAEHIQKRLSDYYSGNQYKGITIKFDLLENLKSYHFKNNS